MLKKVRFFLNMSKSLRFLSTEGRNIVDGTFLQKILVFHLFLIIFKNAEEIHTLYLFRQIARMSSKENSPMNILYRILKYNI